MGEETSIQEFNKTFRYALGKPIEGSLELTHNNIRDFLASNSQRLRKEIEGLRKKEDEITGFKHDDRIFNDALDQVDDILNKLS